MLTISGFGLAPLVAAGAPTSFSPPPPTPTPTPPTPIRPMRATSMSTMPTGVVQAFVDLQNRINAAFTHVTDVGEPPMQVTGVIDDATVQAIWWLHNNATLFPELNSPYNAGDAGWIANNVQQLSDELDAFLAIYAAPPIQIQPKPVYAPSTPAPSVLPPLTPPGPAPSPTGQPVVCCDGSVASDPMLCPSDCPPPSPSPTSMPLGPGPGPGPAILPTVLAPTWSPGMITAVGAAVTIAAAILAFRTKGTARVVAGVSAFSAGAFTAYKAAQAFDLIPMPPA